MPFLGYPTHDAVGHPGARCRLLGIQPLAANGPCLLLDFNPPLLIDPDTSQNRLTYTGNGKPYHLVFPIN